LCLHHQSAVQNHNLLISKHSLSKVHGHIFVNDSKLKLHSRRDYGQIKFEEVRLAFSSESFIFFFPLRNVNIIICETAVLSVTFYVCENWCVTLKEGGTLRVPEKMVLKNYIQA
jgi:hypothetical protein